MYKYKVIVYKVVPWDDPDNVKLFDTWMDAYQYGSFHYGMRFDLIEQEDQFNDNIRTTKYACTL